MVIEVKSICSVESLRKIPEIFGLEKGIQHIKLCAHNNMYLIHQWHVCDFYDADLFFS